MESLTDVVKVLFIPGSVPFLILGVTAGVVLLYIRETGRRLGQRWLATLAVGYWFFSVPVGAEGLASIVSLGYERVTSLPEDVRTLVVLDAGTQVVRAGGQEVQAVSDPSALRAIEAVRVYRLLSDPWVIIQGGRRNPSASLQPEGAALRDVLISAGIPADRINLDSESPSTRAHAQTLAPLLRHRGVDRFVLVTSPLHLRRAFLTFQAHGLRPIPSAAPLHSDQEDWCWTNMMPSARVLRTSEEAVREIMALTYYWSRGWLS